MLESVPTPRPYEPGEYIMGAGDPARLPAGCYFVTHRGGGSAGQPGPAVMGQRVECGGLVIAHHHIPTWVPLAVAAAVIWWAMS